MKYTDKNAPIQCMMTQSTCYKGTGKMTIKGILWHSTGANNPTIKRYVQPDDNAKNKDELLKLIGVNKNRNDWNHIVREGGVNAWVGLLADGSVATVQTLPWDYRPWGCGSGVNGSCNNGWIQFEICEDGLNDKAYLEKVYEEAAQLTAYLCKKYNIDPLGKIKVGAAMVPTILCHADSHALGVGNNHGDVNHWFPKFGKSMETARQYVASILKADEPAPTPTPTPTPAPATLKVGDLVSLTGDAKYWSGKDVPAWVKGMKWYVYSVGVGGRVVINDDESHKYKIMSPIDSKYLKLVNAPAPVSEPKKACDPYVIRVAVYPLNYRKGPGTNYAIAGTIQSKGAYTIIEEATDANGELWGKLKSGAGWIMLKYANKL